MHPDDMPPAERPKPLPTFPGTMMSFAYGMILALLISASGAESGSPQWWSIVVSWLAFTITSGLFIRRLVRYVLARMTVTITPKKRDSI